MNYICRAENESETVTPKTVHHRRKQQNVLFGGGGSRQGLVEPRDIVLNLITHVVTKELSEGLVPHQNYWGDQCPLSGSAAPGWIWVSASGSAAPALIDMGKCIRFRRPSPD